MSSAAAAPSLSRDDIDATSIMGVDQYGRSRYGYKEAGLVMDRMPGVHLAFWIRGHVLTPSECCEVLAVAETVLPSNALTDGALQRREPLRRCHLSPPLCDGLATSLKARIEPLVRASDVAGRVPRCFERCDGPEWVLSHVTGMSVVEIRAAGERALVEHRDGPWCAVGGGAALLTLYVMLAPPHGDDTLLTGGGGGVVLFGNTMASDYEGGATKRVRAEYPTWEPGSAFVHNFESSYSFVDPQHGSVILLRAQLVFTPRASFSVPVTTVPPTAAVAATPASGCRVLPSTELVEGPQAKMSDAELGEVLLFLGATRDLANLMTACKTAHAAVGRSWVWKRWCFERFGAFACHAWRRVMLTSRASVQDRSTFPEWNQMFADFSARAAPVTPCAVWPMPTGVRVAVHPSRVMNTRAIRNNCLYTFRKIRHFESAFTTVAQMPCLYGDANWAAPQFLDMPSCDEYMVAYADRMGTFAERGHIMKGNTVDWCFLPLIFERVVDAPWVPALLIDPPQLMLLDDEARTAWRRANASQLRHVVGFPAVHFASMMEVLSVCVAADRRTSSADPAIDELHPFYGVFWMPTPDDTKPGEASPDGDLILVLCCNGDASAAASIHCAERAPAGSIPSLITTELRAVNRPSSDAFYVDLRTVDTPNATHHIGDTWRVHERSWCWVMRGAGCLCRAPDLWSQCVFP